MQVPTRGRTSFWANHEPLPLAFLFSEHLEEENRALLQ